ncbi:MAG: ABC transporter permease [Chitinivibrionales bacterium]|nr:ABC transporter permease [Chitinivibrionales bacterium]MBD3358011.1 ABC transporter permease [Chitinivibrionales bacterium]
MLSGFRLQLAHLQGLYGLVGKSVVGMGTRPWYAREIVMQMQALGADSLPIVSGVVVFIGMALALQVGAEFAVLGLQLYTGRVVSIAVISEIGPVVTAIVFAGRSGSGMASELGSMQLRNQIDTFRVFGVDPVKRLVSPRLLAAMVMLPCLTAIGDAVSLLGAAYIDTAVNNQSLLIFWNAVQQSLVPHYVVPGILKPIAFGFIIASISCYEGLKTSGGAVGLRRSTTRAFVFSTLIIIITDFVITKTILLMLR